MIEIDGNHLSLDEVIRVARLKESVHLTEAGRAQILESRRKVESILAGEQPIYGINTGFGVFADRRIPAADITQLNRNLILSHATGTGAPLAEEVVRAGMLVRANTLTKGYSGVQVSIVDTLLEMLNREVTPVVPSQGSLGSSGDLGPLSSMALVFTTDLQDAEKDSGWAIYQGTRLTGKAAMHAAGIPRIILGPKDGLGITNGATFTAAIGAMAIEDAYSLVNSADIACGMSLEAMMGCSSAFDPRIHQVRGLKGQIKTAAHIRSLLEGSTLINTCVQVQDAYSLRCAPQVHGAVLDTIEFIRNTVEAEINAATDNPLIFDDDEALSGGNFHGEPVGLAMDYLAIALTELAAISERRVFRMTDGKLNAGLPPMLVDRFETAGLNSGLMMPQYTAASLVLENRTLATPDSVNSLPTSAEQEDHNANAMTAARHARHVVENAAYVIAIELFTAARALDLRLRQSSTYRPGEGVYKAHQLIRNIVPYQPGDAWWTPEIELVYQLVRTGELAALDSSNPISNSSYI